MSGKKMMCDVLENNGRTRLFLSTTYHGQYLTMQRRQIKVRGRGAMPMLSVSSSSVVLHVVAEK